MATETIIWLLPVPPLLAFFLITLVTNRDKALSHFIGVGAALLSWAGGMVVFWRALQVEHFGEHPFEAALNWLPTGASQIGSSLQVDWFRIGVLIDPLSAATLFFVAWTIFMIFLYSVGYQNFGQPKGDHDRPGLPPHGATVTDDHGHSHKVPSIEPMYARFFAFLGLFAAGMYILVISDNLLTLFVGWEIMGLCSYLLIGFWYAKPSARAAAIKAFMTTRIGDVFMLLGHCVSVLGHWDADLPQYFHRTGARAISRHTNGGAGAFRGRIDRSAALYRHGREVSPMAAARLAPGCHGRSDPGLRHDPCGDHGFGRGVHGDPDVPTPGGRLSPFPWPFRR